MKYGDYKYCMISKYRKGPVEIIVTNNEDELEHWDKHVLHNVSVYMNETGICIDGKRIDFYYTDQRMAIEDLDVIPMQKYIKHCNGLSIFGLTIIEPYDYVKYYYASKTDKNERWEMPNNYIFRVIS